MESSLGQSQDEDVIKFTRLVYQITTERQNKNIIKHLELSGLSELLISKVVDAWQTLKIVDKQTNETEKLKKKIVVRASQVLNNNKD